MQLLLLRHGRTEWNQQGRLQGRHDSPLTAEAKQQLAAMRLHGWQGVTIYCSDLGRAKTSAQLLAQSNRSQVVVDCQMRERCFGILEGKRIDSTAQALDWQAYHKRFIQPLLLPGVEREAEFEQRIRDVLQRLQASQQRAILVGHGEWLRACINLIQHRPSWHEGTGIPANAVSQLFDMEPLYLQSCALPESQ